MSLAELELTKALAVSNGEARADRIQYLEDLSVLAKMRQAEKRAAEMSRRKDGRSQASKADVSTMEGMLLRANHKQVMISGLSDCSVSSVPRNSASGSEFSRRVEWTIT